jgi:cysteine desulfurase / selenocysteine lyase
MTSTLQPTAATTTQALSAEDVLAIRAQFPVLQQQVYGKPLAYLDSGATAQKPQAMIDAMTQFYQRDYGTVRRGVYALSEVATQQFDTVRQQVATFINAPTPDEVVFTRGCTEGINLVAACWGRKFLAPGDEVLITAMEHHANIVPWQRVCQDTGAILGIIPIDERGVLDMAAYGTMLQSGKVKFVSVIQVSNVLGTVNPVADMARMAHEAGALILVDAAQSVPHMPVDVQALDCDFLTFSAHKLYGPTGLGVLHAKMTHLEAMDPWLGGGDMIDVVTFESSTYAAPPRKFEAGTPAIAEVIGLGAAIKWLSNIGIGRVEATEQALLAYATQQMQTVPGLRVVGTAPEKAGVISFVMDSAHPLDIGTLVDHEGVAIRTGHHCAQPLMRELHLPATARASLGIYNTPADIDQLVQALHKVHAICGG